MNNVCASLVCALSVVAVASPALAQVELPSFQVPAPAPAAASASAPASPASTIVERVLVRVNGEILTQSQLRNRQIEVLRSREGNASTNIEEELARITPNLLVAVVDELLLVQHGRELGLSFREEQFKTAVENLKKQHKLDDAGFQAALAQDGMTMEELRQTFERSYLVQGVQQREIGPSMTITAEEQRQYYKRHADKFMTAPTVTLRELFITVATVMQNSQEVFSVAEDNAVRTRVEDLRTRAVAGEDFAALVAANSESATKASGGLVGPVNVEDLSPALKELVAKLEPGGISDPVRTPRGYQLFKLETRSVPELRPFDEVRREIESAIRNERIDPETEKMLARLRTQAVIEWKDEALRQVYEKRLADGQSETVAP